ncbi:MAG: KdsC family phosphatase [Lautropia sp.]
MSSATAGGATAAPDRRDPDAVRAAAQRIRLLAMDVDGTLTDGTIRIGAGGELYKTFSVRDGFGLTLLAGAGIELALITGRRSAIVEQRAAELGIRHVHQGVGDKRTVLTRLCTGLGIPLADAAFIGDDWPDLGAMAACGLAAAPADAVPEVLAAADWIAAAPAGDGAVRELAMLLLDARDGRAAALARFQAAAPKRSSRSAQRGG